VALGQIDTTVGDLAGNADAIVTWTRRAAEAGAHVVAFPEMSLCGYPCEDLVLRTAFVQATRSAAADLARRLAGEGLGDLAVVFGSLDACPDPSPRVGRPAGEPQNVALLAAGGEIRARYAKHHLPNYGVFDEFRYFVPGDSLAVIEVGGVDIALTVCEDMWQEGGPFGVAGDAGAGLIVCINASPYERSKDDFRHDLAVRRAREAGSALAFVNAVGGQDELVFDGDSFFVGADGTSLGRAAQFAEHLLVADLELPAAGVGGRDQAADDDRIDAHDGSWMRIARCRVDLPDRSSPASVELPGSPLHPGEVEPLGDEAEVWAALVTGTRDYVRKNGFRSVVLGLSGGIDSAVVAAIAVDALGPGAVHVVGMPSRYSSAGSVSDAEELAKRLRLEWTVVPIAAMVDAYTAQLATTGGLHGLAEENLQARVRGTLLMALSNEHGHLVLTTGNKSEIATGFSTLYGDSAGGFAPIKDVFKSLVWELARWRNHVALEAGEVAPIPQAIIDKPPSAELAPGQVDADRLPSYDVLDPLLDDYVVRDLGRAQLVAKGYDDDLVDDVIRLVDLAEYKRRQYPPGPKISPRNFGRDRRLPITNAWRERRDVHLPR
jgi:NAD+ synthase (glutamine-hydrolysing)